VGYPCGLLQRPAQWRALASPSPPFAWRIQTSNATPGGLWRQGLTYWTPQERWNPRGFRRRRYPAHEPHRAEALHLRSECAHDFGDRSPSQAKSARLVVPRSAGRRRGRGVAARPRKRRVRPRGNDHVRVPVPAGRAVALRERRRAVGAGEEFHAVGDGAGHGQFSSLGGPAALAVSADRAAGATTFFFPAADASQTIPP